MNVPEDLRYSADHEWVRIDANGELVIGITDYAQDNLGEVVFVDLPTIGQAVNAGEPMGEVESTKSVSDIFCPVTGTITAVNADLADAPERLNDDPYGEGWICVIEPADAAAIDGLMTAEAYRSLTEG